jgi:murein DD-endopeptidase MepM/ murein hydrolase activator NlpD
MSADAHSAFGYESSPSKVTPTQPGEQPIGSSSRQAKFAQPEPTVPAHPRFSNQSSAASPALPSSGLPGRRWSDVNQIERREIGIGSYFTRLQTAIQNTLSDQITPLRLASHLSVLAVAAVIFALSQRELPQWDLSLETMPGGALAGREAVGQSMTMQVADALARAGGNTALGQESLQRAAVPFTIVPERPREEISVYEVEPGDTVLGIAEKFGLQPETIQWSNPSLELNPDLLSIGDQLKILPYNGVLHTVSPGDTLSTLAKKYRVQIEDIVGYEPNAITDAAASLMLGTELVVPGGTKPYVARQVAAYSGPVPANATRGSGTFVWPASGSITQRFWNGHRAIDVGSWSGSPVKAADSGYVAIAGGGWNGGYGNYAVVDHGNGYISLYAHLNSIFVRPGENVVRGQQLGTVGNTGNSTGPHLHFEIRYQGVPRNPFSFLP